MNTMYLPIKTKTKRKGVAKPLKELLPPNIDIKQFKDDLLSSFKEVTISKRCSVIIHVIAIYAYMYGYCPHIVTI